MKGDKRKKRLSERGKLGVKKRQENIMREVEEAKYLGTIIFDGPLFKGKHIMTCFSHTDHAHLRIKIDDKYHKPQTVRGLRAVIAKRIF